MSVVSENMTRASALLIARANVKTDGKDWLVYEVESALEIVRHVRLRNDAPFLSDDNDMTVIELCACGQCKPDELRCVAANVAVGDFKLEPSVERNVHGEDIKRINALTPSFDACKLDDLERAEKVSLAATSGPWHRGRWAPKQGKVRLEVELRCEGNNADASISAAKPDAGYGATVIGGCGCCGSPFGKDADVEHIVTAAPDATLQLVRRAKMLARFVELCDRWLVTLMTVEEQYRLVLTPKSLDPGAEILHGRLDSHSYRSPDLERLINHAWANAPSGDV